MLYLIAYCDEYVTGSWRGHYILVSIDDKLFSSLLPDVVVTVISMLGVRSDDSVLAPPRPHCSVRLSSRRKCCPLSEYSMKLMAWFVYIRLDTMVRHSVQMAAPCAAVGGSHSFSRISVTAIGPVRMMNANVTNSNIVVSCCSVTA